MEMCVSFWEQYPIPQGKIKEAIELRENGVSLYEIHQKLLLHRSGMLYWMGEYERGRRWEN